MRVLILTMAIVCGVAAIPAVVTDTAPTNAVAVLSAQEAQPQPAQPPQINVDIDRGGRAWYANPVWIAIGGAALLIIVLLVVMAGRGGGTTVVRG